MKKILFVLFLSISTIANSQVWISKDAVWHYDWSAIGSGGFIKIEYEKDTLINNKMCNKLVPITYVFGSNQYYQTYLVSKDTLQSQFTYANGDTVFYFVNGKFFTLYNFGAKPGDSWNIGIDSMFDCSKSFVKVDSIGTIVINAATYRWISLSTNPNSSVGLNGKIVERFGAIDDYLFPTYRSCMIGTVVDFPFYSFDCFQDDNFSLYNVINMDCEYLLSVANSKSKEDIEIYPTPTSGKVYISNNTNNELFIRINTITGIEVYSQKTMANNVDLSDLNEGIYFLQIEDKFKNVTLKKIVKIE